MEKDKLKYWSNKKLLREWSDIDYFIRNFSYGRYELHYQSTIEGLLEARGVNY